MGPGLRRGDTEGGVGLELGPGWVAVRGVSGAWLVIADWRSGPRLH